MADDYFDPKIALNPETGNVVPGAQAQIFAMQDTAAEFPLEITDLADVPLAYLIASPTGVYPAFKVVSGETDVYAKSGPIMTPITSKEGSRGEPGEPGPAGEGLPDATSLPDGYVPVVASGTWTAAPGGTGGGGGGGTGSLLEVYWVDGVGWPTLPAVAPPGIKSRWFIGGPTEYTGVTWEGVRDIYVAPGV
ncbi:hypothetical protein [Microbacterium sp. NPDC078849]|uniref:hypothetical protein n=1 Tax=unclassified Microbacterium TaxID=2609290 RepID=UPI00344F4EBE